MKRRTFLGLGAAGLGAGYSFAATEAPLGGVVLREGVPTAKLLRPCPELDEELRVEGAMPALRGVLYRNGPGRFSRGGRWKRSLLDGDGYVQAFRIDDGRVRYRSRYVRTEKFVREEALGRFDDATWSTQAPGGAWRNLGGGTLGYSAGVTVIPEGDALYAFDEPGIPYRLHPETLETLGRSDLGHHGAVYQAHARRIDGALMFFGAEYGRVTTLHVAGPGWHRTVQTPESHFVHDWFVTPRWCVILLQPLLFDALGFLLGRRSLMSCIRWSPEMGTRVLLLPRDGRGAPRWLEADPLFFLHGINAFESGDEVVMDLITYPHPRTIFGPNLRIENLAVGRVDASVPKGETRRLRLRPTERAVRTEPLPFTDCEFPVVARPGQVDAPAYTIVGSTVPGLFHGVARLDPARGTVDRFDFGPAAFPGEPAVTPDGHVLVEVFDTAADRTFLAVFRAEDLRSGPVARAWLSHGVSPGFHGAWRALG